MFESAELGHRVDKATFRAELPRLRAALLDTQFAVMQKATFPIIILISGVDGAGKGETINVLYEWLDPRYLTTLAFSAPSDEERARPTMWRYWRALPAKGQIGIFAGSWYSQPLAERIAGTLGKGDFDQRIDEINRFEAMLVNEGALVLKFWFHLSRDGQSERLKALAKDPKTAWRVNKESWARLKTYAKLQRAASHALRLSNTPCAPWIVVEGFDDRYRSLTVANTLLEAMKSRLVEPADQNAPLGPPSAPAIDTLDVLSALDLTQKLGKNAYEGELARWQGRLAELVRHPRFARHSLILAFEGSDAAGKGGSIRRVTAAIDARQYQVVPVAAPTDEERAQPYLWRFWRHLPRVGRVTIFDRSWYGRVLVERVENLCAEADWRRAYSEINDFENELHEAGAIVMKFWLQISDKEQLKRFKEREKIEFKRFKITAEDWRNREKSPAYHAAVCEMVERTSTTNAPWSLIEADDKYFSRVKVLRTICERLENVLHLKG